MQLATSDKVAVTLNPVPGFCVKSRATNDALVPLATPHQPLGNIHAEKGLKVFVNIAWDANVPPPPPPASDHVVRRAMQGLDGDGDGSNTDAWFIPIALSDARQDSDKAGQPAIVFDCVANPSIKSRCLRDPNFKRFIIELAFQRIETQTTLILSRQIGTPNIASKGKPQARRALVSKALYPPGHPNHQAPPQLLHRVADRSSVPGETQPNSTHKTSSDTLPSEPRMPVWSCTQQGPAIRIVFDVPGLTYAVIPDSTLDVEPRRVILHVPGVYDLDLDLDLDASDSDLTSAVGRNNTANEVLKLKHMRDLDVDNAKAEWRVADRTIVLLA